MPYDRRMRILFACAVAALLANTGCGKDVSATINCKVTETTAVDCTVEQTKGTDAIEACWEFNVTCENGATLKTGRTCATVADGKTTSVTIPPDKVTIEGTCDKVKEAEIANKSWKAVDG